MRQRKCYIPAPTFSEVVNVGLAQAMAPSFSENKPLTEGIVDHDTRSSIALEFAGGATSA